MPKKNLAKGPQLPGKAITLSKMVASANRWRDSYNPLRGLTLPRAVALRESYNLGQFADLQWTFSALEGADEDLFALVDRRTSALQEMDWNIKQVAKSKRRKNFDQTLADEQKAYLEEKYGRIDNIYEAIEHFSLSSFRGFSHCEKHLNAAGDINHLEILDQWNVVRDGSRGWWKYNPDAQQTTFAGLPAANELDPGTWIIRENRRFINNIALMKAVRAGLSNKDWDAFIEIYGIPGVFIIGPPNLGDTNKEQEFQAAGEQAAQGGSGYLPNGTTVHNNDSPRGNNPFRDRMQYLSEKLILAGTGGLLTMLTQSGSGTLAGSAHMETFKKLAKSEARQISEGCFQRQIDAPGLAEEFPDQPVLAYFQIAANEETNTSEVVKDVQTLALAGFRVSADQISEMTGYTVTEEPAKEDNNLNGPGKDGIELGLDGVSPHQNKLRNRAGTGAEKDFNTALASDIRPYIAATETRLQAILTISDPALRKQKLAALWTELAPLERDIQADPSSARLLQSAMAAGFVKGLTLPELKNRRLRTALLLNGSPDQPRDGAGKWTDEGGTMDRHEQQRRGEKALGEAIKGGTDALAAMDHPELGAVDFRWGAAGDKTNDFAGGHGLAKVIAKHGEQAARKIPQVLAQGEVMKGQTRAFVEHEGHRVVLSNNWKGTPANHWVVSSYEKEEGR